MNQKETMLHKELLQIKRKRLELQSVIASLDMREARILEVLGIQ